MTLKRCPCGQVVTTKSARKVIFTYEPALKLNSILWFTCVCTSTMVLRVRKENYKGARKRHIKE